RRWAACRRPRDAPAFFLLNEGPCHPGHLTYTAARAHVSKTGRSGLASMITVTFRITQKSVHEFGCGAGRGGRAGRVSDQSETRMRRRRKPLPLFSILTTSIRPIWLVVAT